MSTRRKSRRAEGPALRYVGLMGRGAANFPTRRCERVNTIVRMLWPGHGKRDSGHEARDGLLAFGGELRAPAAATC